MKAWQIKNGPLNFTVMKDKALDLAELSYKGINMSFLSKPGLQGRNHYDTNGQEAQRSIMGGMMFTCGLENICAPYTAQGKDYPMHGRIRTTPAEHTGARTWWEGDSYLMSVQGEMREAELFGENMVLKRKITTSWPGKEILIEDTIENQGFREEPAMLLYHFNYVRLGLGRTSSGRRDLPSGISWLCEKCFCRSVVYLTETRRKALYPGF